MPAETISIFNPFYLHLISQRVFQLNTIFENGSVGVPDARRGQNNNGVDETTAPASWSVPTVHGPHNVDD